MPRALRVSTYRTLGSYLREPPTSGAGPYHRHIMAKALTKISVRVREEYPGGCKVQYGFTDEVMVKESIRGGLHSATRLEQTSKIRLH